MKPLKKEANFDLYKLLGGKWKPAVILTLYRKPARFNRIKFRLGTISANQLTRSLGDFEKVNLVKKGTQENPIYSLTTTGNKVAHHLAEILKIMGVFILLITVEDACSFQCY